MRKTAFIIALVIPGALALLYFYLSDKSNSEITTVSPNKTYRVYMQDRAMEGFEHQVRFNVAKNGKQYIDNESFYYDSNPYIYSGLKYTWASENVLRFGEINSASSLPPDEISVVNQTNRIISYLKVTAWNEFLLLELQPQTTIRLFDGPQTDKRADMSWIGGFGRFDNGKEIFQGGRNFTIRDKYRSPSHYCIIIKEDRVVVQSREYGGQ